MKLIVEDTAGRVEGGCSWEGGGGGGGDGCFYHKHSPIRLLKKQLLVCFLKITCKRRRTKSWQPESPHFVSKTPECSCLQPLALP